VLVSGGVEGKKKAGDRRDVFFLKKVEAMRRGAWKEQELGKLSRVEQFPLKG